MIHISIICVGKLKEKATLQLCNEFEKRLQRYAKIHVQQVADEKAPTSLSPAQVEQIKELEGARLLQQLPADAHVVGLDLGGKTYTSEQWATWFDTTMTNGTSSIAFIIGGSHGLGKNIREACHEFVSFSSFTFSHQIMRIILLEQIYRAMKINANEPYHK